MCQYVKKIYNRYSQSFVWVNCGYCKECLQDKAERRALRIRNSIGNGEINLFVTLTYDNRFLPVIKRSDIDVQKDVPVYRYMNPLHRDKGKTYLHIDDIFVSTLPYGYDVKYLRSPKNYAFGDDYVSICYYKDLQDFIKRLRINLQRDEKCRDKNISFKYYACSEYGPTSLRSHFHLSLTIPRECELLFRAHILKAWPFADSRRTARNIKVAYGCAEYLASYVNCDSSLPKILRYTFKPRHSYSQKYGVQTFEFSPVSIWQKINRGALEYTVPSKSLSSSVCSIHLLPKYVVNRYFPLFKGYGRLSPDARNQFFNRIEQSISIKFDQSGNGTFITKCKEKIIDIKDTFSIHDFFGLSEEYSDVDKHRIAVSLRHHCESFCNAINHHLFLTKQLDKGTFKPADYFRLFDACWRVYNSTKLKLFYYEMERLSSTYPYASNYDNLEDIPNLGFRVDNSIFSDSLIRKYMIPNSLPQRVEKAERQTFRYNKNFKRRKVTNSSMEKLDYYV